MHLILSFMALSLSETDGSVQRQCVTARPMAGEMLSRCHTDIAGMTKGLSFHWVG